MRLMDPQQISNLHPNVVGFGVNLSDEIVLATSFGGVTRHGNSQFWF